MTSSPTDSAKAFISDFDVHLFSEGTHLHIYEKLGAHPAEVKGVKGIHFALWAPNATSVSVIGDFNKWDASQNPMTFLASSGIWTCFIPALVDGTIYKYYVQGHNGYAAEKCDPLGFAAEMRPKTASVVWDLNKYKWQDAKWQEQKLKANGLDAPISIYEVHLGSWMRVPEDGNRWLTYREMAEKLVAYVVEMGFTHVELMPVSEHPLDASWGYQTTGYFAATSRFGTPEDLMHLIDSFHQKGIGVLLDWVPAHFPKDGHALGFFDGTHLYEHADPRQGEHREWGTYIFNYGRYEVRNFLLSNAMFWFDRYHIDGLRVDAVASMLYLDYARKNGEWLPNQYGGRENIEAIDFLRMLNEKVYTHYPAAMMIAEESTAWPLVTRPPYVGGLGFGFKWDMGWMNDTLQYMSLDPVHRKYHHDKLTFRGIYSFSENYILPLSHDEVVHLKHSIADKMPGDGWQLLEYPQHQGIKQWVADLNHLYTKEPALHENDCHPNGFEWIDCQDSQQSILCYLRKGNEHHETILVVCNFTPVPRWDYRVGVPHGGFWKELLNSDALQYGGSGMGNMGGVHTDDYWHHGRQHSLNLTVPPLSIVMLKPGSK
jgi:1,4-alpha-glucan branching enzyme